MRSRPIAVLVAMGILFSATACGTRRSEDDLAAAAGAVATPAAAGADGSAITAEPEPGADAAAGPTAAGSDAAIAGDTVDAASPGDAEGEASPAAGAPDASPGGPAPAGAPGAGPAVATAEKKGLVIGSVGSISGLVGAALKPGVEGLQVWVKWINSKGGLNGHPVRLIVADDQGDPARHRSLVQQLVEQQGVIAFVQNAEALTGAGSVSFHQSRRIPVIGSEGSNEYWNQNSMYFPQMSHGLNFGLATLAGQATWATGHGYKKIAQLTCTEAASCTAAIGIWKKHAKHFGLEVVYQAQASLAKPDYTAECLNARNAGAEVVSVGMDGNAISRVAAACARQGYFPAYTVPSAPASPQHLNDPNMKQLGVDTPVAPFGSAPTGEIAEAFAKFLPDTTVVVSHVEGWTAGKMLERAARDIAEPTSKALLEGLWSIKGEDLGGLSGPQTFTRDKPPARTTCWFVLEGKNGKFVPYNGGKRTCTDRVP